MLLIANILVLALLVSWSRNRIRPVILAFLYMAAMVFFRSIIVNTGGMTGGDWVVFSIKEFALGWLYFWLLHRTRETKWWWVVLFGGFLFGLV